MKDNKEFVGELLVSSTAGSLRAKVNKDVDNKKCPYCGSERITFKNHIMVDAVRMISLEDSFICTNCDNGRKLNGKD